MQNYQEWFSIKELMEKNLYLPGSDKGIVKKAAREGWQKRQRQGVKGKTFEYHYTSFPIAVQQQLGLYQAEQPHSQVNEPRRHYTTEVSSIENTQAEDHIPIPFYACFSAFTSSAKANQHITLMKDWLTGRGITADKLVFVSATGDSMLPTIHHGDLLLINREVNSAKEEGIYVIRSGKQIWIKRIQGLPNGIRLMSDNKTLYPPLDLSFEQYHALEIIGKVIFIGHHLI
ncbi:TPA: helix-turn-helix transcriptional regulator [Pasteurella multocida]|uniref:helix-turn-helix domain-containing protein n=1 Tax=Pasteurella multocida TaxID=747 RepID=UPI0020200CD0|nr:helix-turn-helix transcriptional regulator [Pasteurella multocida]MCL7797302.1 helix-turn-helix transcriptional regulator [Pasteurella multocida]MCL7802043.1 helix-turn-helix transcriptional regulator [Pasteurella multocida]MDG2541606.1 helix-turn-helix transcriptional regulator [Pasteurella multocida]HDR0673435.1 helix-turn-helix transcriptional regulator [Pasteurella multocida]HDR0675415.1 helix-turn-helix transcriptional regulator [Pasteurella multocida]